MASWLDAVMEGYGQIPESSAQTVDPLELERKKAFRDKLIRQTQLSQSSSEQPKPNNYDPNGEPLDTGRIGDLFGIVASGSMGLAGPALKGLSTLKQEKVGMYDTPKEEGISGLFQQLGSDDSVNKGIGQVLSAVNPMLGMVYGVARAFGFNPTQGVRDYRASDKNQRIAAGYNGRFFGNGSWQPVSPYSPTGTYSGSGYGNMAGPGSGSNGTPLNYTAGTTQYGYSNPAASYGGIPSNSGNYSNNYSSNGSESNDGMAGGTGGQM